MRRAEPVCAPWRRHTLAWDWKLARPGEVHKYKGGAAE